MEKKEIESEFQRSSREHREYLEKSGIVPVQESCILVERDNYVEEVTFQQYQKEKEQEANALQQSNIECVCDNNYNTYCHSVGPIKEILVTDNIEAARTTADLQKFEDLQRKKPLVITKEMSLELDSSKRDQTYNPIMENVHRHNMKDLAQIREQRRKIREDILNEKREKFFKGNDLWEKFLLNYSNFQHLEIL